MPFQTWPTQSPTTMLSLTPPHTATPLCLQTEKRQAHESKTDQDVSADFTDCSASVLVLFINLLIYLSILSKDTFDNP